jgi:beta-glucosidase
MNSVYGPEGNAGAFGGVTQALRDRGVPAVICADGPSGVRLATEQSLVPSATTLASTFDVNLVESLYFLVGLETVQAGVDCLLAPGMNIQRDPRCGRNFEYFSEDPLVTGKMAAAVVRGLRTAGVAACPKHLCANNQERMRNISDSRVSERALREIYLRGFEICVTEAHPQLIMMSYNRVNGTYAHYNFDLATTILRREWGFTGLVITDWWMKRGHSPEFSGLRDNGYRIRAGVDVLMPGNLVRIPGAKPDDRSALLASRAELQQTAVRVLGLLIPIAMRKSEETQG